MHGIFLSSARMCFDAVQSTPSMQSTWVEHFSSLSSVAQAAGKKIPGSWSTGTSCKARFLPYTCRTRDPRSDVVWHASLFAQHASAWTPLLFSEVKKGDVATRLGALVGRRDHEVAQPYHGEILDGVRQCTARHLTSTHCSRSQNIQVQLGCRSLE